MWPLYCVPMWVPFVRESQPACCINKHKPPKPATSCVKQQTVVVLLTNELSALDVLLASDPRDNNIFRSSRCQGWIHFGAYLRRSDGDY